MYIKDFIEFVPILVAFLCLMGFEVVKLMFKWFPVLGGYYENI